MAYVAVKGGEQAIRHAHAWLGETRRGDPVNAELEIAQIEQQLGLAVDRVMAEGSCLDRGLAALAIKQAQGDLIEAIFLLRAYRTTLPRFGYARPLDTAAMRLNRRVSATYKDLPGGQVLGPTYDYTHRLLDFSLARPDAAPEAAPQAAEPQPAAPHVTELLSREGLMAREPEDGQEPADLTRQPQSFPADRSARLQNLARGDEGFLLSLGYSTQRGYGNSHPFVGEIRQGLVTVSMVPPELGFEIDLGEIEVTECQMVNQFHGSRSQPPQFTRGYGLVLGRCERKAMSMALVDRALQAGALGEDRAAPVQDEEFVMLHSDNVEATGFVEHLKLPHYVDFQSELEVVRRLREAAAAEPRSVEAAE